MYHVQPLFAANTTLREAITISPRGAVVGATSELPGKAVIWRENGTPQFFSDPKGLGLYGINDRGIAVGARGVNNSPTQQAIVTFGGGVYELTQWVGLGAIATDINNANLLCGSNFWSEQQAFVFDMNTASVRASLQPLPGDSRVSARALNQAGDTVGISQNADRTGRGYCYRNGEYIDLGPATFIDGVNDRGQVCGSIGVEQPQGWKPLLWNYSQDEVQVTDIPIPTGFFGAHASDINNAGEVVGHCWNADTYAGRWTAYRYRNGVSTDLNTLIDARSGWHLETASSINDAGQIVGSGYLNGSRDRIAFLLTPIRVRTPRPRLPRRRIKGPELEWLITYLFGGVAVDGGGWGVTPGGKIGPIPPWSPLRRAASAVGEETLLELLIAALAVGQPNYSHSNNTPQTRPEQTRQLFDDWIDDVPAPESEQPDDERMNLHFEPLLRALGALGRYGDRKNGRMVAVNDFLSFSDVSRELAE
jgi:probable HAF family extracellular repeat protein